jgi:hypothetical protein
MIISRAHNFIFIKTRKTAGSSMEMALASHVGPEDVVTPLGFAQDLERFRAWSVLPQNFSNDPTGEQAWREAIRNEDKRTVRRIAQDEMKGARKMIAERHGSATEAKELAGEALWRSAFKFAVERHPYEKAVSFAWYRAGPNGDFAQALQEVLDRRGYRNFDLYAIDGVPVVDLVLRYEKMEEDLPRVEQALGGLPILSRLPRANSHQRKDRRPAREILTTAQKARIQETCREEFALYGYEP